MKRALAESRPWLFISLAAGISYFFVRDTLLLGDIGMILWKGAGVAALAVYAFRCHSSRDGYLVGLVMAFSALGDMLLELNMIAGALAFIASHGVAIWLYSRHRRTRLMPSQKLLALLLPPLCAFIAWSLPFDRSMAIGIALYAFIVATMAAMAWTSYFPRYRTGTGAMMFLASDLLIFTEMGPLSGTIWPWMLIWPLYYFGQFLICTSVIASLRHHDPRVAVPQA